MQPINGDGKLSKDEFENLPAIAQRFQQIDANKDGFISKTEYLDALGLFQLPVRWLTGWFFLGLDVLREL
jgi:EF hand